MKLALTVSMAALALLPIQNPPQRAALSPTGRIEGTVLRTGSDDPLAGARITLLRINASTGAALPVVGRGTSVSTTSPGSPTPTPGIGNAGRGGSPATPAAPLQPAIPDPLPIAPVITDVRGHFILTELEPGAYRVAVSANGYVRQEYGQRIFPGQGTLLNLAEGQTIRDLVVHLTQTGNVSGRITDNMGQLAVGVPVQIMKAGFNVIGQRIFQDAGSTRTNDRGEYRIYWVTPGKYIVAAGTSPGPVFGSSSNPNDSTERYSYTFFPGTPDTTRASTIEVQSGGEAAADFSVPVQHLFHVRGKVADSTGRPPLSINVSFAYQLITGEVGAYSIGQSYDSTTGKFDVPNISPGVYVVQVAAGTVERATIEVSNTNVENLSFVLGSGAVLNGRIRNDNPNASLGAGWASSRVQLRGLNVGLNVGTFGAETDGTFKVESITPAEYRAVVSNVPTDVYVKEVRLGGLDMMVQTLRVADATPINGTLDVVLSPNVSQIEGVVLDDRGQPMPGVQTVLVPDRNREHTELFKPATTDQTGHFTMRGLAPGDYKLFAWTTLESFGYFDPELLKESEPQARAVHISESSKLNLEIRAIR